MRPFILLPAIVAIGLCRPFHAATNGVVFIEYFHSADCAHCEEATRHVAEIAARYAPMTTVLQYRLFSAEDWRPLLEREQLLGVKIAGPLAVYVGTTALYGVEAVVAGLEPLVVKGIAAGGVAPWRPPATAQARLVPQPPPAVATAAHQTADSQPSPAHPLRKAVRTALIIGLVVLVAVLAVWSVVRPRR